MELLAKINKVHKPSFNIILLLLMIETLFTPRQWMPIFHVLFLSCCIVLVITKTYLSKPSPVYLIDFSCFKPPKHCRIPFSTFIENASKIESFDSDSLDFMAKILTSSGQSEETYLPPALHYIPPKTHQRESLQEVQMVLFPIVEDLLSKTKVSSSHVDILIVNCSGFCPSPSLSSIVINRYSMRPDIKSYNLSGMGCSAGAIAIDLAKNLLNVHNNSYALILSAEILSTGWYNGNEKSKLLLNCTFRMGSSAVLLTNKKEAKRSAKYKLFATVRTQNSFEDKAYGVAFREEDCNGKLGVTIGMDLQQVVAEGLKSHVTIFGSRLFPLSEKLRHGFSLLRKWFLIKSNEVYMPDFKGVIEHFCLPTSGRPMIREIAKGLRIGKREVEAPLMTFHRFGNQSSSSLWYELAYLEAKERVKKGHKVWQLGFGSGTKCCSLVWECLRPIVGESNNGPWEDCTHLYPDCIDIQGV